MRKAIVPSLPVSVKPLAGFVVGCAENLGEARHFHKLSANWFRLGPHTHEQSDADEQRDA